MRKVLVNAQVTAMISSIESLFVIVHIAGVAIAGKKTTVTILMVMLLYMVLFLIILPYSFLMNTSHNKNRIIEHGWKNVIQNLTVNNSIFRSVNLFCTRLHKRKNDHEKAGNKTNSEENQIDSKRQNETLMTNEQENVEKLTNEAMNSDLYSKELAATNDENVSMELRAKEPQNPNHNPIKRSTNIQESSFVQERENVEMLEILHIVGKLYTPHNSTIYIYLFIFISQKIKN